MDKQLIQPRVKVNTMRAASQAGDYLLFKTPDPGTPRAKEIVYDETIGVADGVLEVSIRFKNRRKVEWEINNVAIPVPFFYDKDLARAAARGALYAMGNIHQMVDSRITGMVEEIIKPDQKPATEQHQLTQGNQQEESFHITETSDLQLVPVTAQPAFFNPPNNGGAVTISGNAEREPHK